MILKLMRRYSWTRVRLREQTAYLVNGVYLYRYSESILKSTTIGRYLRHRGLGNNPSFINSINSIRVHGPVH